jgi:hypothetical protein
MDVFIIINIVLRLLDHHGSMPGLKIDKCFEKPNIYAGYSEIGQ